MITPEKLTEFVKKWNAGELETIPDADGYFQDLIFTVRALWKENADLKRHLGSGDYVQKLEAIAGAAEELTSANGFVEGTAAYASLPPWIIARVNHMAEMLKVLRGAP